MDLWWILFVFDGLLFAIVAITVVYFLVFSFASLFIHHNMPSRAKAQKRFIVLITSYKQDKAIRYTVDSILGQTYPQRMFDVVVISDHQKEITNMQLAQQPITLLTPNFDESSKVKSLQYAIFNLPKFKIYDAILLLDAGDIVKPEFMEEMNDAFSSSGSKAVQIHCISANRDNPISRLSSTFEEINNAIFRRGHQILGLSAALNSSGSVFDFQWFKESIMKIRSSDSEEKALEGLLMRDNIYIDYFEDIYLYKHQVGDIHSFNKLHAHSIYIQIHALINNLRFLPGALINRRYDHIDKIIQWMLIPRTILMGIIALMSIIIPFIYMTPAIKWWVIGALALFSFAMATPNYLVDSHWDKDFLYSPRILIGGLQNIFRAGGNEATTRVSSISKWIYNLRGDRKAKNKNNNKR